MLRLRGRWVSRFAAIHDDAAQRRLTADVAATGTQGRAGEVRGNGLVVRCRRKELHN